MIVNRRTFNVKPGCLEEIVQLIRDVGAEIGQKPAYSPIRVLTAVFGPFDVLVLETTHENMEQYQQYWIELGGEPAMVKFFEKWYTLIAGGGTNEIWDIR